MTESVSGLNLNAFVRYRGVDVGRVRAIALAPATSNRCRSRSTSSAARPSRKIRSRCWKPRADRHRLRQFDSRASRFAGTEDQTGRTIPGDPVGNFAHGPTRIVGPVLLAGLNRVGQPERGAGRGKPARAETHATDLQILADAGGSLGDHRFGLQDTARTMRNATRFTEELPRLVQRSWSAAPMRSTG
jgi:phospholipid/cholesterol/gamma-HCH transport system substrate-binding protein